MSENPTGKFAFPISIEIEPKHVGWIGEEIFNQFHWPPEPIQAVLREYCRQEAPDWVDIEEFCFRNRGGKKMFVVEKEDEILKWECDGVIGTSYSVSTIDQEKRYDEKSWSYKFLVEIKTGEAKLDYQNQRTVMEYYSQKEGIQPLYIRLGIDLCQRNS